MTVRVVSPAPPDPLTAVVTLEGVDNSAVLRGSASFELAVETTEDEQFLVGSDGIDAANTVSGEDSPPGVALSLSETARERFAGTLEEVGALDAPGEHSLVTYYEGERIWEGSLAPNLAMAIRDGDWDGGLVVTVADRADVDELARALGLVSVSVPADVAVEDCTRHTQ